MESPQLEFLYGLLKRKQSNAAMRLLFSMNGPDKLLLLEGLKRNYADAAEVLAAAFSDLAKRLGDEADEGTHATVDFLTEAARMNPDALNQKKP